MVLFKNENKLTEMVSIMETLQCYVPQKEETVVVSVPGKSDIETIHNYSFHHILLSGDQLTPAHCRRAQVPTLKMQYVVWKGLSQYKRIGMHEFASL